MDNKYELKNDEIIRVEDDKVVAKIEDGKVVPTAPVYYKIIDELDKIYEDSKPHNTTTENAPVVPVVELNQEAVAEAQKSEPVAEEKVETTQVEEAPEMDPLLGDRTPAYMAWLRKHNPEEATNRYGK